MEPNFLCHKVIGSKFGVQQKCETQVDRHSCMPLDVYLLSYILSFVHCFLCVFEIVIVSSFGKIIGLVTLLLSIFNYFFFNQMSSLRNAPISHFLLGQRDHIFWNFQFDHIFWNFHSSRNLNSRIVDDLAFLFETLAPFHVALVPNRRIWDLDPLGSYTCTSFFKFLIHNPNTSPFILPKFILKAKPLPR